MSSMNGAISKKYYQPLINIVYLMNKRIKLIVQQFFVAFPTLSFLRPAYLFNLFNNIIREKDHLELRLFKCNMK